MKLDNRSNLHSYVRHIRDTTRPTFYTHSAFIFTNIVSNALGSSTKTSNVKQDLVFRVRFLFLANRFESCDIQKQMLTGRFFARRVLLDGFCVRFRFSYVGIRIRKGCKLNGQNLNRCLVRIKIAYGLNWNNIC